MEKKFTALRIIATIYKIAGVLIALGTVLAVFFGIVVGGASGSNPFNTFGFGTPLVMIFGVVSTVIAGGLAALGVFAIGEALFLLINLEENTRFSAIILRDRFYPPAQPPRANPSPLPTQQPPVA